MRYLRCSSIKGFVKRLINTSELNENEKGNLKIERTDPYIRRKAYGERIRSNPKKKNSYDVILFCFVRVVKTWFPVQFGVNKHGLIFKDNTIAQARNLHEKKSSGNVKTSKMRAGYL